VGLRKLLARKPAEDPLERLAALGREEGGTYPSRPFRHAIGESDPAPACVAPVDEKAGEISVGRAKKAEPPRSRSGYCWVSQRSRSKRAGWADMPERF
jgi:hypothetical protein